MIKEKHICWSCGKTKYVNHSGVCADCWIKYASLRSRNDDEYFERMAKEAGDD